MTTTLAVEDITLSLPELIDSLPPGGEVILTRGRRPVGRLLIGPQPGRAPRVPGNCEGMITLGVEDEEHLTGFPGYP